jgi:hypothetical protein
MRLADRSVRVALAAAVTGVLLAAGACTASSTGPTPVATLPSTPVAAAAFDAIREAWRDPKRGTPAALRAQLEDFLVQYPRDGLVPLAHVYLALVELQQSDFAAAERELALGERLPPGTTRDLWTVARAQRLRMRGQPEQALDLLRPLVGKNVDPLTRARFEEELTLAALATGREYEAISYMDAWLRASSEDDKAQTVAAVTGIVQKLPKEVLVGSLQAMRSQRASFGYGVDIERILAERLVQIATTSGDAELARMLLDPDAGALVVAGDAGEQLGELATSRRGLNVVEGRTVGLLLPIASTVLRDEAAAVLRGVMWALGLPRGVRTSGGQRTSTPADGGAPAAHTPCAALEPAPPLEEPSDKEQVRLVTRDDAGSADRTEVSLDELAGEGASIVIAGLDAVTAARALRWGENHGVTVVALVPPTEPVSSNGFGFVLGEPQDAVLDALARAAPALTTEPVTPLVDASEMGAYAAEGSRRGPLQLLAPVSCDAAPARAGDPRFPVAQWDRDKRHAWLVTGSPACARDVVGALSTARSRGVVALSLEAAALPAHGPGLRVLTASAGVVPETAAGDARDDELRRFEATLGTASWWTALGRDAATLARVAVRQLPTTSATAAHDVAARRAQARDLLAGAHTRLWTTESTGWTPERTVTRTVCAVEGR